MNRKRRWSISDLKRVTKQSTSIRQIIDGLGLVPAGGNYDQVKRALVENKINISHITGSGWRKGKKFQFVPRIRLEDIFVKKSTFQSYKLKKRLFAVGLKKEKCERCGWAEASEDGRIPVELDHINGDKYDNRLQNLRILCPNCHSLQSTHRGKNQKRRGGEIGRRATLKMS
jgi:hypothetical protein